MQLNYLESLIQDKKRLVRLLKGNGVICLDSDTFTTLIPKINYMRGIEISDLSYLFALDLRLDHKDLQYNCSLRPNNISHIFYASDKLTNDLFKNNSLFYNLDLTNCTTMDYAFSGCDKLTDLDLSNWIFDPNKDYDTHNMFHYSKLNTLSIGQNIINLKDPVSMFAQSSLAAVNTQDGKIICKGAINSLFSSCPNLSDTVLNCFEFKNITDAMNVFFNCKSLTTLDLTKWDLRNVTHLNSFAGGCSKLQTVIMDGIQLDKITDTSLMLQATGALTTVSARNVNIPNATTLRSMFNNCQAINIDLTNFKAPKVRDLSSMFGNCKRLESIDLSSLPISDSPSMSNMFQSCNALKHIILNLQGTCKTPYNFQYLLANLPSLETVDTENWHYDFPQLYGFFKNCPKITRIDLSNVQLLNSPNPSNYWFVDCAALAFVNISKIDLSVCTNLKGWFTGTTPQDCEIIVKDEASKTKLLAARSTLTNVKTKEEYENGQ